MRWTKQQEDFIRKNIHLTNQELAENLNTTLSSVENKVRELGLARTFQKHEVDILRKVWGKPRRTIEAALPRFKWRQISKKANNIGLPSLKDVREAVNLYSVLSAMGSGDSTAKKWLAAGLCVISDKGKKFKQNVLYVDIDEFWNFALQHPDIVDICRLPEDVLGVPPDELVELRKNSKPFKKHRKRLNKTQQKELANMFLYDKCVYRKMCRIIRCVNRHSAPCSR